MIVNSASLVYSPTRISLIIGENHAKPLATITRKLDASVLTHTTYTDGTVVLPLEVEPIKLDPISFDEKANNLELDDHYRDISTVIS